MTSLQKLLSRILHLVGLGQRQNKRLIDTLYTIREPSAFKVYLAGPDVFLSNAVEVGAEKKRLCADYGFVGLFPFDNEVADGPDMDRRIFEANMAFIREAHLGIFNLTPFRGVSADVGTVFELGAFIAMGKPVFAYSNDRSELLHRVQADPETVLDDDSQQWRDSLGMSIEDFGNADNLMIDAALAGQGRTFHRVEVATEDRFTDLAGFKACLEEAQRTLRPAGP